ncbi:MAG: 1-acyl-sn-glycerol-3-phosphate acyltransferase [Bacteroidota bacterium]|jgi:putative hemolysin
MKNSENKSLIDIDSVFKSKNPGLYSMLPSIFFSWLKKTVHQEEINSFIHRNGHRFDFEFIDAIISEFGAQVEIEGLEHIPETGGFVVAANHPLGGLDAISLIQSVGKKRADVRFIVNDILLKLVNLKGLFIGVNKHGKNDAQVHKNLDELYASGMGVLIFPAGLVSRKKNGLLRDLEWRKSFIIKSKKNRIPVIPAFIDGENSAFFYKLSNIRKRLGLKANIEMLYLPDEMYKQKGRTIRITFGKPVDSTAFENPSNDREWADKIKNMVYSLSNQSPVNK